MENASNALMIAAGVLIGLLILSLGVYLIHIFGDYVSNTQAEVAENTLAQFNQEYLKYNGLDNLTIQDIVTVKNNALENNFSYSNYNTTQIAGENNAFVDVYIGTTRILDKSDEELLRIELQNLEPNEYKCQVKVSSVTGRVFKVIFTPN